MEISYRNALIITPWGNPVHDFDRKYLSYKTCKELTCTILCGLLELLYVAGFNHLAREIIGVKVEENYFFLTLFFDFGLNYFPD